MKKDTVLVLYTQVERVDVENSHQDLPILNAFPVKIEKLLIKDQTGLGSRLAHYGLKL